MKEWVFEYYEWSGNWGWKVSVVVAIMAWSGMSGLDRVVIPLVLWIFLWFMSYMLVGIYFASGTKRWPEFLAWLAARKEKEGK